MYETLSDQVKILEDTLLYLTDCTLGTIEGMAAMKSRKKTAFNHQIALGQRGVNTCKNADMDLTGTRVTEIIDKYKSDVRAWASRYDIKRTA